MSDAEEYADDGLDLRELFFRLLSHWWWIVLSVVLCTAAFIGVSRVMTPIYRSSVLLIPAKSSQNMDSGSGTGMGGLGSVASMVGINLGGNDSQTEEALAVLRSREFTQKFIDDLNLMPVLYAKLWDAKSGTWKTDEKHRPTPNRAYRYFDKSIRTITPEKKTSLITVSIDWTDRFAAAQWANELIRRLNLEMRQREMARADSAVGYLEKEFETTTTVATREAIGRLIESQVKQRMLATVTPEFAFRVIDSATPSDKDELHSPNKFYMAVSGPIVGGTLGVLLVMGFTAPKPKSLSRG